MVEPVRKLPVLAVNVMMSIAALVFFQWPIMSVIRTPLPSCDIDRPRKPRLTDVDA